MSYVIWFTIWAILEFLVGFLSFGKFIPYSLGDGPPGRVIINLLAFGSVSYVLGLALELWLRYG